MSLPPSHKLCLRCVARKYNPPLWPFLVVLVCVIAYVGWAARGRYEDYVTRHTLARLCETGVACFEEAGR